MSDESSRLFLFVAALAMIAVTMLVMAGISLWLTRPWLRAMMHGTPVSAMSIIGTRLRGNPTMLLIDAYIAIRRAGISATFYEVENLYVDARSRISQYMDLVELVEREFADRSDRDAE